MTVTAEKLARTIVERLQGAGYVAYFAGGCVRDRLMGRTPKDFDVATSATPEEVLGIFPKSQQVGAAFGVILVYGPRDAESGARAQVEVATFRADGDYSDGRHPDSVRFTTAQEDAKRRDFTCNGLFWDPLAHQGLGQIHDFVGGQQDILDKVLRAIGNPDARFREDHLRLLRAVRFAARLEFAIDPETLTAIKRLAPNIQTISRERIGEEFRMILEHPSRGTAVRLMESTGLLKAIMPFEIAAPPDTRRRIDCLPEKSLRPLVLAAFLRDGLGERVLPDAGMKLQQAFALSNQERDDFAWLSEKLPVLLDRRQWKRSIHKRLLADSRFPDLHALYVADHLGQLDRDIELFYEQLLSEPGGVAPAPFVTGNVLIELGASPGPNFRAWLEELYDRQLENEFPDSRAAIKAAQNLIQL